MNIYCFTSKDFESGKFVYEEYRASQSGPKPVMNPWATEEGEQGKRGKKTPERPSRRELTPRQRASLAESQRRQYALRDQVTQNVEAMLKKPKTKKAIADYTSELGNYTGWTKWNKIFAEKMGITDPGEAQEKIKAMQRVLFDKYNLAGDPGAIIDGRIGPYTLAVMALESGQTANTPTPGRNINLAARTGITGAGESLESAGESLLSSSMGKRLEDGTYVVKTGDTETFFRFHDGKWEWASKEQKENDAWVATGNHYYEDDNTYAYANAISKELGEYMVPPTKAAGGTEAGESPFEVTIGEAIIEPAETETAAQKKNRKKEKAKLEEDLEKKKEEIIMTRSFIEKQREEVKRRKAEYQKYDYTVNREAAKKAEEGLRAAEASLKRAEREAGEIEHKKDKVAIGKQETLSKEKRLLETAESDLGRLQVQLSQLEYEARTIQVEINALSSGNDKRQEALKRKKEEIEKKKEEIARKQEEINVHKFRIREMEANA
ncbi:hypothetical protein JXD20_02040 [Candidatus Peregrinibacteria bacterium]|nr:hypothetical protein [Candidatus Peregrinibacteria bacterium]